MSFTVVKAAGNGQVQSALPGMLVAFNQLDDQFSTEVTKTEGAFQELMEQMQENFRALAAENVQLRQRVTMLENHMKVSDKLRAAKEKSTLELIDNLKMLFKKKAKEIQIPELKTVPQLTGHPGGWPLGHNVSSKIAHNYNGVQMTRSMTNRALGVLYKNQCELRTAINKLANEMAHLKFQVAANSAKKGK